MPHTAGLYTLSMLCKTTIPDVYHGRESLTYSPHGNSKHFILILVPNAQACHQQSPGGLCDGPAKGASQGVELHHMGPIQTLHEVSVMHPLSVFMSLQVLYSVSVTPGEVHHHILDLPNLEEDPVRLVSIELGVDV